MDFLFCNYNSSSSRYKSRRKRGCGKLWNCIFNYCYDWIYNIFKRVLENIKISNIIEGVYLDCDKLVDKELELRENAKRYNNDKLTEEIPILAESTGYLFKINSDAILKNLKG